MRPYRCLVLCVALFLCLQSVVAIPHSAVRRQDKSATEAVSARSSTIIASSKTSTLSQTKTESESNQPSSTVHVSVSTRPSSPVPAATTSQATTTAEPASESSAEGDPKTLLPYQPKLTPAMGVSGVILVLTGLVYAIIGIKNKWIYVFGSAAYLTALAVTALIIYLMSPPVANAIEGAFFVAAFFSGIIFGGLSLVFSDITEGLGCLLGGFCLSMWFLSLKEGGLIASTTGRAIFIGCMSAGGYCLSFSHHTRNYGLIASISFSGATVAILGIDCLSSTGWKEFWLYLWNLNSNSFPLNTNTFPLTKNMKAELAGVVIIAAFGIVSQLRVWNLVKDHRAKNAADQAERQQNLDREEEELGRKIEDNYQRERAQWESTYGEKSTNDSSVGSRKDSTVVQETEISANDGLEKANLAQNGAKHSTDTDSPAGAPYMVSVHEDDNVQHADTQGNPILYQNISNDTIAALSDAGQPLASKRSSLRASVPPPPPVVPLPFKVPEESDTKDEDDNTSVSAVPESEHESVISGRPTVSKRISDMAGARYGSGVPRDAFESEEHVASHADADRASSVAATLDDDRDDISVHRLSPTQSPIGTEHDVSSKHPDVDMSANAGSETATVTVETDNKQEATRIISGDTLAKSAVRQSLTASTDPKENEAPRKASSRRESRVDTTVDSPKEGSESQQSKSGRSVALSVVGSIQNVVTSEKLSKVALSYRTNEWAKHLEAADRPELDELAAPGSPSVTLGGYPEELAAPVSDEIAAPLMGSRRDSKRTSTGSAVKRNSSFGLDRSASGFSQNSLAEQQTKSRPPSLQVPGGHSRSSSGANPNALSPLPANTLLGQRESRIKNRISSHSLTPYTPLANVLVEQGGQENMTLAQRRQLLQNQASPTKLQHQQPATSPRHAPPSASQKWQKKSWAVANAPLGFDSHAPRRTPNSQSDQKREELYAGWRDIVQDITPPQTAAAMVEQQRLALLNEKRQKEMRQQQRESIAQRRASMMDSMMRSGHMLDAHREAMRKMQASANKNA